MSAAAEICRLADGRRLAFERFGARAGRPVLYCHGFPGSRLEASLADAAARELEVCLVAIDRPGFGRSDAAPRRTLASWPADVAALVDQLGLRRFHLVGVSGGGPYALACAARLAERLLGVAVVSGLGELTAASGTRGMVWPIARAFDLFRRLPGFSSWLFGRLAGPLLGTHPELILRGVLAHAPAPDRATLAEPAVREAVLASFREAVAQGGAGPAQELALFTRAWDIDPRDIRVPVQIWHGDLDRTVPAAMGRRHAQLIPGAEAVFLPEEGHFSLVVHHAPQILIKLLTG